MPGFGGLYEGGKVTEAACGAHVRRKFHDIHAASSTSPLAREALERIGKLYAIDGHRARRDVPCLRAGQLGRPSSSMRFIAVMAMLTSVARRRSVRDRRPSPMTRLKRLMSASTKARQ